MTPPAPPAPAALRPVLTELTLLWLLTLLLIRGVVMAQQAGVHEIVLALVPFLFVYAPVWLCRWRGADPDSYGLILPAFRDLNGWWEGARPALQLIAVVALPWLASYHLYQNLLFGFSPALRAPADWALLLPYHLFYVAIPEEFFYRGYFQRRLSEALPHRWTLLGARIGWSLPLTCLFFAFGHSVVTFRWWHFAIFFPSLAFGWLREKTDNTLSGAFFHAWCNITVAWLDAIYGVR